MAETLNETDELDRLFDAITPRDGSMPDLGDIQIAAERAYPVVRAERARSQGLLTPGEADAVRRKAMCRPGVNQNALARGLEKLASLSTAPGAVEERRRVDVRCECGAVTNIGPDGTRAYRCPDCKRVLHHG